MVTSIWRHERIVWVVALVAYGIGDTITTLLGLRVDAVSEAGPVMGPVIETYGTVGLVVAKLALLGAFGAVWRIARPPSRVAVPLALAIVGVVVTGWNAVVILVGS